MTEVDDEEWKMNDLMYTFYDEIPCLNDVIWKWLVNQLRTYLTYLSKLISDEKEILKNSVS